MSAQTGLLVLFVDRDLEVFFSVFCPVFSDRASSVIYYLVRTRLCPKYSARREDDTSFIFSHFGLFLCDAASNSHK